jgi:RNA polymerase sigma factor (sigma-70 family)
MLEDEWLKWKFRRGSREALARIYEKYLDSLLTLAMGLLNNASEAQDVVHDVFVSFAQSAPDFGLRGSLSGYLATSVVNRVRDHKRRLRRQAGPDAELVCAGLSARADQMVVFNEEVPPQRRSRNCSMKAGSIHFKPVEVWISVVTGVHQHDSGRAAGLSRLRTCSTTGGNTKPRETVEEAIRRKLRLTPLDSADRWRKRFRPDEHIKRGRFP